MMLYEWAFPVYHKFLYSLCFDTEVDCGVDVMSCDLHFEGYTYARSHNACKLIQHILQLITNNNQQATAPPSLRAYSYRYCAWGKSGDKGQGGEKRGKERKKREVELRYKIIELQAHFLFALWDSFRISNSTICTRLRGRKRVPLRTYNENDNIHTHR